MNCKALRDLTWLILLAAITLGSCVGSLYLVAVAVGGIESGGQLVGIVAVLTIVGLFLTSVGWTLILMGGQQQP